MTVAESRPDPDVLGADVRPTGDTKPDRKNRILLGILAVLVAILILLLLEISGAFGYRIITAIADASGLRVSAVEIGPPGVQGQPGVDGSDGATGSSGPSGSDGRNGQNGADGAVGPQGVEGIPGRDGVDGAPGIQGPQGEPGTVLAVEQGIIGIGSCDSNVVVSISSRFDVSTMRFLVGRVSFHGVSDDCWGRSLDVYLFTGTLGAYSLAATASDFVVPQNESFDVPYTAFDNESVESADLSKLAIELSGAE